MHGFPAGCPLPDKVEVSLKIKGKPVEGIEGVVEFDGALRIHPKVMQQEDEYNSRDVLAAFLKEYEGKKVRLWVEVME